MANWLSGKKKIITMILGVASGLAIAFGLDQGEINIIAGAVVSMVSVAGYLLAEGKIDVERIKTAAQDVNEAIELLEDKPVVVTDFQDAGGADNEQ